MSSYNDRKLSWLCAEWGIEFRQAQLIQNHILPEVLNTILKNEISFFA